MKTLTSIRTDEHLISRLDPYKWGLTNWEHRRADITRTVEDETVESNRAHARYLTGVMRTNRNRGFFAQPLLNWGVGFAILALAGIEREVAGIEPIQLQRAPAGSYLDHTFL